MSPELDAHLRRLLSQFERLADRVPTPAEPPDSAAEQAAEEWVHRYLRHEDEWDDPSPEAATALIPRIMYALLIGTRHENELQSQERYKDRELLFDALEERLLVEVWNQTGRASWLRGEWDWPRS